MSTTNRDNRRFLAWVKYHHANPHVLETLVQFARQARAKRNRIGIQMLVDRLRWYATFETKSDDGFKICENHKPYYSRLIMALYPDEFTGFFATRDVPTFDATIEEIVAAHRLSPGLN